MRWLALVAGLAVGLTACGGSSKSPVTTTTVAKTTHTYVLKASSRAARGIYVTVVSPVAIPRNLMTQRGAMIVGQAQGPQVCSFTKMVHNPTSSSAFLDGKTVTVRINGSNPLTSTICALVKKQPFDVNRLGGM